MSKIQCNAHYTIHCLKQMISFLTLHYTCLIQNYLKWLY